MLKRDLIKKLLLTGLLTFLFVVGLLSISSAALAVYAYKQWQVFSHAAEISATEFQALIQESWVIKPKATNNKKNILLLGVDSLETRSGSPPLTDTILLISLNLSNGGLNMISLPRDLWSTEYQTKINALYYYGLERYPKRPEQFPEEVFSDLLEVPIHHTIVLSMNEVSKMVDLLGGVEVDVKTGFTDDMFPRPDVDVTSVSDPELLYKSITFEPGKQIMSGERALEFIRSRHSEGDEGDDLARSQRQLLVIESLLNSLRQRSLYTNPARLGTLFKFYNQSFSNYLPMQELLATGKTLHPHLKEIAVSPQNLSLFPDNPGGVIWHPPVSSYNRQWVYAIRDDQAFKKEIADKLQLIEELTNQPAYGTE